MSTNTGLSIYLHIPFCRTRCTYCDFNIYTNLRHLYRPYTAALCLEIERSLSAIERNIYNPLEALPPASPPQNMQEIETVFLGGGTPSLLPPALLEQIMASLLKYATFKPGAEITLEANPGTLTLENLQTLRVMGVNRLSYGAQTYDDAHLKRLGRAHDSFEIDRSVALAREAGFENISLDFIYGLPDETLESWNATLERALALRVEHFSLYGLILEENTSLGRRVLSGKLSLPPDDLTADMYLLALEKLEKAGYVQYEISNWARDSVEEFGSRHNMVYWRNSPYLGFGPGAHSCFTGYRYSVIKDPREYIKKLGAGESVIELEEAEELTTSLRLFDSIMLGLRMNKGISLSEIENEFGKPLEKFYPGLLDKLISLELLQEVTGAQGEKFISLTTRGRLLSNNVFMEFLPAKNLKGRD